MGIPKYRYVEYMDDGHCHYQCLSCKEILYVPNVAGWKFCPFCACQWTGQLEWDERAKEIHKCWKRHGENFAKMLEAQGKWRIEERSIWRNDDPATKPWKDGQTLYWSWRLWTARDIFDNWKLYTARNSDDDDDVGFHWRMEYRLIYISPAGVEKIVLQTGREP